MDRFSISLKKEPPVEEIPIENSSPHTLIDPDFPPEGVPYRVFTHELENLELNHSLYMEAINATAQFSCNAGSIGDILFSVRLISNAITEKFELQLVFLRK